MDGGSFYGGGSHTANMTTPRCSEISFDSNTWVPDSYPDFHAAAPAAVVNLEQDRENTDCYEQSVKRRRLSPNQVRCLEKSFESDSRLEPERKFQLARELKMDQKQVAIWFQNRKARYKHRILEGEYNKLKDSYNHLAAGYHSLIRENESIRNEVNLLTEKLAHKENEHVEPNASGIIVGSVPIIEPQLVEPVLDAMNVVVEQRQEDTLSDVFDSESPRCCDNSFGAYSLLLDEEENSMYIVGHEAPCFSPDEDNEYMRNGFLESPMFRKIQDDFLDNLEMEFGNTGAPIQDQGE